MEETTHVKAGLAKLMHNVVLLRDPEAPDIFTPVSFLSPPLLHEHVHIAPARKTFSNRGEQRPN